MDCENCTWSMGNHTNPIAMALTCGAFSPRVRNAAPIDPDRCPNCGEAFTPRINKGATKCKCDVPKPPRWVLAEANNKPLPGQVRYGGR